MGLINIAVDPSIVRGSFIKELALAKLLNTNKGDAIIAVQQILNNFDEEDKDYIVSCLSNLQYGYPLSPIDNPMITGDYTNKDGILTSCRCNTLFSADKGETWHDSNKLHRFFGVAIFWQFIYNFAFSKKLKKKIEKHVTLVTFPYDPNA